MSLKPLIDIILYLRSCFEHISTFEQRGEGIFRSEMQGCAVYRGVKAVGRQLIWCRPNLEYHRLISPVGTRFALRTTPSHVSIPPNQNGTMANSR